MTTAGKILFAIVLMIPAIVVLCLLAIVSIPFMFTSIVIDMVLRDRDLSERVYNVTPLIAVLNWLDG